MTISTSVWGVQLVEIYNMQSLSLKPRACKLMSTLKQTGGYNSSIRGKK